MKNSILKHLISRALKLCYLLPVVMAFGALTMCTSGISTLKYGLKMYVSPAGNDNWTGKLNQPNENKSDGPFASLEGARSAIRNLKQSKKLPKGNIIVEIQEGIYEVPRTFELDSTDGGGDARSRIIYLGQQGSEVRLTGGKYIRKWDLVSEKDVLEMLSPDVRDKIYQSDLSTIGISDFGSPGGGGIELFFNDKPMWISRYPNKGFIKITGLLNEQPVDVRGTKGDKVGKFKYDDQRIANWKKEKDAWVHGYWFWDWAEQRHKIAKIDPVKKIIEVEPPYHSYGYRIGQWFYGFNLLSEIDEPGEYYLDREKGTLYFYPPSDIEKAKTYVSLVKNIINVNKASFLTIKGLILEGCRETAVKMQDCNNNLIAGCTIRNVGDWGVTINEGVSNGVRGCDIYNAGGGGINIRAGNRKTLVPGNCFADNNYIHHIARLKRVYNPGVTISGVGNTISHNIIAHLPHMAVGFSGNEHIMEYNEIYDVSYESNDAGAIYSGRNWTYRGNILRYNYLHDISGFEGKGCVGIYLDDAFSSADMIGNIFNKVTEAVKIGGGRDNNVLNNIFIDCIPSLEIDARGLGWMADSPERWVKEAEEKGTILGIAYNQPPYSTRYPKLVTMLSDEPAAPKGNVIALNVCSGGFWDKPAGFWGGAIEKKARPYLKMEDNIVASNSGVEDTLSKGFVRADPLFVNHENPEEGKFQLDANSPALKLGFKQIPFDKIGLYQSDDRASWPVIEK